MIKFKPDLQRHSSHMKPIMLFFHSIWRMYVTYVEGGVLQAMYVQWCSQSSVITRALGGRGHVQSQGEL